jgi:hypothetical protein
MELAPVGLGDSLADAMDDFDCLTVVFQHEATAAQGIFMDAGVQAFEAIGETEDWPSMRRRRYARFPVASASCGMSFLSRERNQRTRALCSSR